MDYVIREKLIEQHAGRMEILVLGYALLHTCMFRVLPLCFAKIGILNFQFALLFIFHTFLTKMYSSWFMYYLTEKKEKKWIYNSIRRLLCLQE